MQTLNRSALTAASVACALALAVAPVDAQDVPEPAEAADAACTAEVSPAEVPNGSAAVELTVTLPDAPGPLTGVEAAPTSGIALASPADLPRSEMAEDAEEAPRPIAMGESANSWTIWLNTANATPGRYQLTFNTGMASCHGEIIVG